jgi:DNA-binding MarR family transcriptional regulator
VSSAVTRAELTAGLPLAMRETLARLTSFNQCVGRPLGLNSLEFLCVDLINRHEPITPGRLAHMCGVRPATITGVLDRLETAGWVSRERDGQDRRRVLVHARHERASELGHRLGGMRRALREISERYEDDQLALILDFLNSVSEAGKDQAAALLLADKSEASPTESAAVDDVGTTGSK